MAPWSDGRRSLAGRAVVITGAGGGLGQALTREALARGAKVALLDLSIEPLHRLLDALLAEGTPRDRLFSRACDVTDAAACEVAIEAAAAHLGGIDLLMNNAGITQRSAFADTELRVYRQVMEVNFFGALHCTKAALPHLRARRGQIVVLSSVAGFAPLLGRSGYCASKHALHGFFDTLRAELRPEGIGVLIVSPSFIATPIDENALGGDGQAAGHAQITVGSVMQPAIAARAILGAAERDRCFLALGRIAVMARILCALWPRLYERLMIRSVRAEVSNAGTTPRA